LLILIIICNGYKTSSAPRPTPKIDLLIDNCFYSQSTPKSDYMLNAEVLLVNNTNHTLYFLGTETLYTYLYHVSNKNLVIQNNFDRQYNDRGIVLTVPPHSDQTIGLAFKFNKMPDTTFKFRVGMSLINLSDYRKPKISYSTLTQAPLIWSNLVKFRTNRKHEPIGMSGADAKEIKLREPWPIYYPLTKQDRKNYVLSIDQHKVAKRDTLVYKEKPNSYDLYKVKQSYISVPLKFTNYSNDTLKYLSMSCSWWEFYQVDVKGITIMADDCTKNIPHTVIVFPHKSLTINVPLDYDKNLVHPNSLFRIGMSLQKNIGGGQPDDADAYLLRPETSNLIWSNPVKVPQ
jgi:hypothetical protein